MPKFTKRSGTGRRKYEADITELRAYLDYLEKRTDHVTRFEMHREDQAIYDLEKYTLEELRSGGVGVNPQLWPSFTSNGPRTYWNAVRRAVTSNQPRIKVVLPGFPDEGMSPQLYSAMLAETDRHEHFAYGAWQEIDERRVRRGYRPFQDSYAFYMAIRGGAFIRPWFQDDSRVPFDVDIWDPLVTVYEPGLEGLDFVAHHYRTPFYDVYDRYYDKFTEGEDKPYKDAYSWAKDKLHCDEEGNTEIADIWWCEYDSRGNPHVWSCVLGGKDFVLSEPFEWKDMDHVPIFLTRAFGPDIESEADYRSANQRVRDQWETIYTANRNIYPWVNRVLTLYGLYLRNSAIGPWHARGTDLSDEQLKQAIRPFGVIQSRRPDATIQPISMPQMATEVKEFNTLLQGMEQRGAVPYSLFGQLNFELSGFAVNQLQGAISIVAEPLSRMMGFGYRIATDELIQQFRQRGQRVSLKGMDTRRRQFIEDIRRADLRDKYSLEVEIRPELPQDQLQTAQVAAQLQQVGVDPLTLFDEVLKLSSPRDILRRSVLWQTMQQEMQMEAQTAMTDATGMPPPEAQPPEARGIRSAFTPSRQQISDEAVRQAGAY